MYQPLKPALESSKGRSSPWGGARLVNAYAEQGTGDQSALYAVQAIPGLSLFSNLGGFPVRGAHTMGGVPYAVIGTTLYSVDSSGNGTALGTIIGSNPVRMADNGTELAIHNGDTTGYVYSGGVVTTPTNLPPTTDVTFMDGYFIWSLAGLNQFIISGLYAGTSYNPLDIGAAEGSPSNLVGLVNDHLQLLLFKTDSTEIFYDSGNADFPFERMGNAFIERGCIDRNSIAKLDNATFFVGDDRVVYRMGGYLPERISTHPVEHAIDDATWFRAFTYGEEGHKFYVLNTDAGTWVYDVAMQAWHERESFGLDYYRVGCSTKAYGTTLLGDNQTGDLYTFDEDINNENGNPMPVTIQLPPIGDGAKRLTLYALEVFAETGVGDLTTTNPQMILTYSKDGGRNWSREMWRPMGAQGQYTTRMVWRVNVEFRQLQLKLVMPDKVRRCVLSYNADIR
jgi:hypothetical protein